MEMFNKWYPNFRMHKDNPFAVQFLFQSDVWEKSPKNETAGIRSGATSRKLKISSRLFYDTSYITKHIASNHKCHVIIHRKTFNKPEKVINFVYKTKEAGAKGYKLIVTQSVHHRRDATTIKSIFFKKKRKAQKNYRLLRHTETLRKVCVELDSIYLRFFMKDDMPEVGESFATLHVERCAVDT